jgi:hypothetical protein
MMRGYAIDGTPDDREYCYCGILYAASAEEALAEAPAVFPGRGPFEARETRWTVEPFGAFELCIGHPIETKRTVGLGRTREDVTRWGWEFTLRRPGTKPGAKGRVIASVRDVASLRYEAPEEDARAFFRAYLSGHRRAIGKQIKQLEADHVDLRDAIREATTRRKVR